MSRARRHRAGQRYRARKGQKGLDRLKVNGDAKRDHRRELAERRRGREAVPLELHERMADQARKEGNLR